MEAKRLADTNASRRSTALTGPATTSTSTRASVTTVRQEEGRYTKSKRLRRPDWPDAIALERRRQTRENDGSDRHRSPAFAQQEFTTGSDWTEPTGQSTSASHLCRSSERGLEAWATKIYVVQPAIRVSWRRCRLGVDNRNAGNGNLTANR